MIARLIPFALALAASAALCTAQQRLTLSPARVTLDDGLDRHRLVAMHVDPQGLTTDVTDRMVVTFEPPGIAAWRDGRLVPLRDGEATVVVTFERLKASSKVVVADVREQPPVSFRNEVIPILTRAGCNGGACHGAAAGKNGFGLTLFGYDPGKDLRSLSREARGRRIDCADPEASLMLTKPTGIVRHKGGKRLTPDDVNWSKLRDWIADGAVDDGADAASLVAVAVEPPELVLAGPDRTAGLVVTATYSDGSLRDVTDLALISSSNAASAKVDADRVVSAARGEAFVMARFGHLAEVAQVIVLADDAPWTPPQRELDNDIDRLVQRKLDKLRLLPADRCDDATYVRRVYLDVIGQLPTADEVRAFLADEAEDKRARIVDRLLERPEFPAVWAMTWAEVLRIEPDSLETKGVHLFTRWLRESLRDGLPIDRIVRHLLTVEGSTFTAPAANYLVTARDPKVLAENTAQTFLGIRLQCAQCHNHPFERWRMDDYYGFAAFFGQIGRKAGSDPRATIVYDRSRGEVTNARTRRAAAPRFLGGEAPKIPANRDRREVLADWLTSPDNPWFARNVANRVWARFFGRGLVHPVDDVRTSNPPSHPELHRLLGDKLITAMFDIRALVREICASATYQSQVHPDEPGAATFAGATPRRLTAEQLIDAIDAITGVATKFRGVPLGGSAAEIVDPDTGNRLLDLFGRPTRDSVCTCERGDDPTLNQVLHLINGAGIESKVRSDRNRIAAMLRDDTPPEAILSELFLMTYARSPTADEQERLLATIAAAGDDAEQIRSAWQDVLWAMLNSKEFLFQH